MVDIKSNEKCLSQMLSLRKLCNIIHVRENICSLKISLVGLKMVSNNAITKEKKIQQAYSRLNYSIKAFTERKKVTELNFQENCLDSLTCGFFWLLVCLTFLDINRILMGHQHSSNLRTNPPFKVGDTSVW